MANLSAPCLWGASSGAVLAMIMIYINLRLIERCMEKWRTSGSGGFKDRQLANRFLHRVLDMPLL